MTKGLDLTWCDVHLISPDDNHTADIQLILHRRPAPSCHVWSPLPGLGISVEVQKGGGCVPIRIRRDLFVVPQRIWWTLARAKIYTEQLQKPVLVITITDGQPTGENFNYVNQVMLQASQELQRKPRYGKGALSFQFAQVGNDLKAREFLGKLDEDATNGDIIDCTSNYEVEADEMKNANPPVHLTPELWLIKLLLGAIDSSYDTQDEKGSARPPQEGYQQPPQQYQRSYGQGPPGQEPLGQGPLQSYGGSQQPPYEQGLYGHPLPGPPPSQGQGYGQPQGGQYGAPPRY